MKIHPEVESALSGGAAVVALESTIISHGLPRPQNLMAARSFEELLRAQDVVPATIAVIRGTPTIGLTDEELELIANEDIPKASVRDLPMLQAHGLSGATTVAATAHLAAKAGVKVFATGGLGGVHRGANETFDESADLTTLASSPVVIVSAGVKSVLDIGATLERLETLSIPVVGYKTDVFPAFWLPASEFGLDWKVDSPAAAANVFRAMQDQQTSSALVVANPVPAEEAWEKSEHDAVLEKAFTAADEMGVRGKEVTPFLLQYIVQESEGRSLEVNLSLARNNVNVAGEIARALSSQ
ncbi:MAG: pseudouridine-5-phosphate glycosidase [Candidatus Aquiluna sp. XM-24bin5]|nr:MAG: pseudouridine-5-phosphate glycosidase [Candidatus Aquiluna sp. XM-24bin5]